VTLKELVQKSRSYRRFCEHDAISMETLRELVDLARLSPSGGNMQPLKYIMICTPERNALVFPHLAWAAYLKGWRGPAEGERPSAYIVMLGDREVRKENFSTDAGIAAQSIMLGAAERGLGGCMIGSVARDNLRRALSIPERYEIVLVLALGRPGETVRLETVGPEGDIKYRRDAEDVHHVPKRRLEDVIVG
jgi:nitroreductase